MKIQKNIIIFFFFFLGGGGVRGVGLGGGVRMDVNEELKFCENSKRKNGGGGGSGGGGSGWMNN